MTFNDRKPQSTSELVPAQRRTAHQQRQSECSADYIGPDDDSKAGGPNSLVNIQAHMCWEMVLEPNRVRQEALAFKVPVMHLHIGLVFGSMRQVTCNVSKRLGMKAHS